VQYTHQTPGCVPVADLTKGVVMKLLDATLAFVLTMAAFGTIVTILMEAVHRILRVRKGRLILVLQRLNKEIDMGMFKEIAAQSRWDFIASVLNNPTRTKGNLPDSDALNEAGGQLSLPRITGKQKKLEVPAKSDGSNETFWMNTINSLGRWNGVRGIFEKVSLEHILRRFVDLDEVKSKVEQSHEKVKAELNRFARKYEELASAASADFKSRARFWSALVGIALAFTANINAARIFEAYMTDKDLVTRVIGQSEEIENQARAARESLRKLLSDNDGAKEPEDIDTQIKAKRNTLKSLNQDRARAEASDDAQKLEGLDQEIKKIESEIASLDQKKYAASQAGKAEQALADAAAKLGSLSELGVPLGADYFPHCIIRNTVNKHDNGWCLEGEDKSSWTVVEWIFGTLTWFVITALTGLLIGLGAPFWFDVAKRIAEVRVMFGGTPSTEQRLGGKDAESDPWKRQKLVNTVLRDVISDQKAASDA
jgi:hypothetical protein